MLYKIHHRELLQPSRDFHQGKKRRSGPQRVREMKQRRRRALELFPVCQRWKRLNPYWPFFCFIESPSMGRERGWSRSDAPFSWCAHTHLKIRPSIVSTYKVGETHLGSSRLSYSQFPLLPNYLRNLQGKSAPFERLSLLILWWRGRWPCVVSLDGTDLIWIC